MTKIKKKNSILAIILAGAVMLGGCGSSAVSTDLDTETTESLEVTEATETTELEAVEATEATEVEETTETEERETESESEVAEAESEAEKKETYTYTDLNKTMYAKQSVNVRNLPSTDGSKLGSLSSGQAVTVTGQCNETSWYRIEFNGETGYCSNNYLTSTKPSSTSSGSSSGSSNSGSSSATKVTDALLAEYAQEVIDLVNKERVAAGISAYTRNEVLMEVADIRAEDLSISYSHTRPDGTGTDALLRELDPFSFDSDGNLVYAEIKGLGGENIAMGQTTPEQVMEDWMASEGHRYNVMADDNCDAIGVGVYYENGTFYWVQLFAELS